MRWRACITARLPVLVLLVAMTGGCTGPERLTASVTPCTSKEVTVEPSEFSRNGSTTSWCATCKNKLYQCTASADRTKVACHVAGPDDICK